MIKLNKDEIAKRTKDLPGDLKVAAQSDKTVTELQAIAKNHNLHVDQIGTVADLVELTLSGVVLTREFVAMMTESLNGLKREQIMALAEEINRRIFAPYRDSLHKVEERALAQGAGESIPVPENVKAPEIKPVVSVTAPISAPISVPTPPNTAKVIPTAVVEAPKPPQLQNTEIEVAKISAPVMSIGQEKDVSHENLDARLKMIPEDAKKRISSDPYKEPIE